MIKTAIIYFLFDYCIERLGSMLESKFIPVSHANLFDTQKFSYALFINDGTLIEMCDITITCVGNLFITFTCEYLSGHINGLGGSNLSPYIINLNTVKYDLEYAGHSVMVNMSDTGIITSLKCVGNGVITMVLPINNIKFY